MTIHNVIVNNQLICKATIVQMVGGLVTSLENLFIPPEN